MRLQPLAQKQFAGTKHKAFLLIDSEKDFYGKENTIERRLSMESKNRRHVKTMHPKKNYYTAMSSYNFVFKLLYCMSLFRTFCSQTQIKTKTK